MGMPLPATPMERFKILTRRLLNVSREHLHDEQQRYAAYRKKKREV
jgi:hypothetical protein